MHWDIDADGQIVFLLCSCVLLWPPLILIKNGFFFWAVFMKNYLMAGRHVDHCNPDHICLIYCNFKYFFLWLFKALVGIQVNAFSFVSFEGTWTLAFVSGKKWTIWQLKKLENSYLAEHAHQSGIIALFESASALIWVLFWSCFPSSSVICLFLLNCKAFNTESFEQQWCGALFLCRDGGRFLTILWGWACFSVCFRMYKSVIFHSDCLIKVCLIIQICLSAKQLVRGEPNVSYICSRYYRAPELIFGATDYTSNIDVWSAGCVLAELLLGQPIFPGDSGVDQLVEIIKVKPTLSFWSVL